MNYIIFSLGISAYFLLETKHRILSYILFFIVNAYWAIVAYGKGEKILALMLIVYNIFCIKNINNVRKKQKIY